MGPEKCPRFLDCEKTSSFGSDSGMFELFKLVKPVLRRDVGLLNRFNRSMPLPADTGGLTSLAGKALNGSNGLGS